MFPFSEFSFLPVIFICFFVLVLLSAIGFVLYTRRLWVAFVSIWLSRSAPPDRLSPPVSVTGRRLTPGEPAQPPPVAGAGGETG